MNNPRLIRRTEIIIKVNEAADLFYGESQGLGILAVEAFRGQQSHSKREQHRAQMTGLENIAETTMKVSDVLDYVKKQTARQPGWTMEYAGQRFGESLKNY